MSPCNALYLHGEWENCDKASCVVNHCGKLMDGLGTVGSQPRLCSL
jgi:hypothetical protein